MKSIQNILLIVTCAAIAGVAGYWFHDRQPASLLKADASPTRRPDFSLLDLHGQKRSNSEWDGKVVVVNFWATWCPPCVAEIPLFVELQNQYAARGVQFIGIALDDMEPVKGFVDKLKVNYPVLVDKYKGIEVAQSFGNRMGALPFTVVIDQNGIIVLRHPGEIIRETIEKAILPLLRQS